MEHNQFYFQTWCLILKPNLLTQRYVNVTQLCLKNPGFCRPTKYFPFSFSYLLLVVEGEYFDESKLLFFFLSKQKATENHIFSFL